MIESLITYGVIALAMVFVLGVVALVLKGMYKLASKEVSFVRTGMGGEKVVKDGGAFVFPVVHDWIKINMLTSKLVIQRTEHLALITNDRFLVDITAEFFIRVKPDIDSIAAAAQSLGARTFDIEVLKELIEGKAVDALRSVAATTNMAELHEGRQVFMQKVRNALSDELGKNGLELENVSLTRLDQTDAKFFNPNNAFHAEGLAKLSATIAERRQERNKVERDAEVAIAERDLAASQRQLQLSQEQEFATLEQQRQVELARAEQAASLATQRADQERISRLAQIEAERATSEADIRRQQAIQAANIASERDIELAKQERAIAVNLKSGEESRARAEADNARAEAVIASENVKTAEATAKANRDKQIAVISAEQDAEQDAVRVRVAAKAELEAAENRAAAQERLVEADAKRYEVEAAGQRLINEAKNTLSPTQLEANVRLAVVNALPSMLDAMAKPMSSIEGIKIVQVNGLNSGYGASSGAASGNMPDQVAQAALNYRLNVPFVDHLAETIGVDLKNGLTGLASTANNIAKFGELPVVDEETVEEAPIKNQITSDDLVRGAFKSEKELRELAGRS